jgi:hypothetical protein
MKNTSQTIFLLWASIFLSSCFAIKFSKSDNQTINADCVGSNCATALKAIDCKPSINGSQITYTYSGNVLPTILSQCTEKNAEFNWTVKKADGSVVTSAVTGLNGANPSGVDFRILGQGTYYVFLHVFQPNSGNANYHSTLPLEFVVPGPAIGSGLTCDPKINLNTTNTTVGLADKNPSLAANCLPVAASYYWTVTKNNFPVLVSGLSGANSTPNFKALGDGIYKINLYATAIGLTHWESAVPLTVNIKDSVTPTKTVSCNPRLNGELTSLNINSASANPLVTANCLQKNVKFNWSVTKNGNLILVSDLIGANSNVDFLSFGKGVYNIYLNAAAENFEYWHSSVPLTVVVEEASTSTALSCAPRLNKTELAANLLKGAKNPLVTAGCSSADAKYTWLVYRDGKKVEIEKLNGASSTGNFSQAGEGTYQVYLVATVDNLNSYVSPYPLTIKIHGEELTYREVSYEKTISKADNKVDILLVLDDSKSMLEDNKKLSQKLGTFVNDLTKLGVDWQMCATVTRWQDDNPEKKSFWGLSRKWSNHIGNPQWVVNAGANNLNAIFNDTIRSIGAGWENSDDERGIKAAWSHLDNSKFNSCYRADSALAIILVSDEDVRSIGGNSSFTYYENELKFLEPEDQPQSYILKVKQDLGFDKRMTFNSIIVPPVDEKCMASQDGNENSKSHYGQKYAEISQLTHGSVANICEQDYTQSLKRIKTSIVNSMASIPLECAPVGELKISITPTMGGFAARLSDNNLTFNSAIPEGRKVSLNYNCSVN